MPLPSLPVRFLACVSLCLAGAVAMAEDFPNVVPDEPKTPAEQQKLFKVPPGFEVQLVASEPEIQKPINLAFDNRGRLLVTHTIEYPYAVKGDKPGRDAVSVIDFGGDKLKVSRLIDGLNIPIGILPLHGSTLVFSIPNIYRYSEPNEEGTLQKGEKLFGPFDQRDTHGLNNAFIRGVDGWIYACHGFSNESTVRGADGQTIKMQSGNTYRFREDGSHIEHFTFGQVNPFGLTFDPLGNLYSTDCHTLPAYQLLRGAYYPSFGKPHDGLGFGPQMLSHSHGSTGIAGIAYYAATQFPSQYRDTLFIGNPITHRINHDVVKFEGSSAIGVEQPDFLSCSDRWFRPVDVRVGPDGALYIADFYNRIIGHYEVPLDHPQRDRDRGRIWRVVYVGEDKAKPAEVPAVTDLSKATLGELLDKYDDANSVVRTMATHEVVDRFADAAPAAVRERLKGKTKVNGCVHMIWTLQRLKALDVPFIKQYADFDRTIRVHLIKALAETKDWTIGGEDVTPIVRKALTDADPFVQRAAADALGLHPHADNVALLQAAWKNAPGKDTHLVHTIRMALRDQLRAPGVYQTLDVAKLDGHAWHQLGEMSMAVPTAEAAEFLNAQLPKDIASGFEVGAKVQHAVRFSKDRDLAAKLCQADWWKNQKPAQQVAHSRAMQRGLQERGARVPAELAQWAEEAAKRLLATNDAVGQGIEIARDFKIAALNDDVAKLAADAGRPDNLRHLAIDTCVANNAAGSLALLSALISKNDESIPMRQKAAQALGGVNSREARAALLLLLKTAPERLGVEIAAALATGQQGGENLLAEVEGGKQTARVLQEPNVANKLRAAKIRDVDNRLKSLTAGLPQRDDRLHKLIQQRLGSYKDAKPDAAAGKLVYVKNCAACHKVGGEGNKIGPELDGIGNRGLERVLEDVLDPSRNVDQAFRKTTLTLSDGRIVEGLVLREEGEVIVLADALGKEVRVEKKEVEQRTVSSVSPMPANVPDLIKEPEFYDLLAFLLSQQPAKP